MISRLGIAACDISSNKTLSLLTALMEAFSYPNTVVLNVHVSALVSGSGEHAPNSRVNSKQCILTYCPQLAFSSALDTGVSLSSRPLRLRARLFGAHHVQSDPHLSLPFSRGGVANGTTQLSPLKRGRWRGITRVRHGTKAQSRTGYRLRGAGEFAAHDAPKLMGESDRCVARQLGCRALEVRRSSRRRTQR